MPRYTPENTLPKMVNIYLDGKPLKNVIECDDDLGFAIVHEGFKNGQLQRKLLTGKVIVTFRNDKPESAS